MALYNKTIQQTQDSDDVEIVYTRRGSVATVTVHVGGGPPVTSALGIAYTAAERTALVPLLRKPVLAALTAAGWTPVP